MQSQQNEMSAKKIGHQRRPSIGKSMPVSAILLHSSSSRSFDYIYRDGASPDLDMTSSMIFHMDCNNELPTISVTNNHTDDHEINDHDHHHNENVIKSSTIDMSEDEVKIRENFNIDVYRAKLAVAEALAKTSMLTSPAARRRLAARKIEMEAESMMPSLDEDNDYVPPKDVLLCLVRMGSFNSTPKIDNIDSQDDEVKIPEGSSVHELVEHCKMMRGEHRPSLLSRYFLKPTFRGLLANEITDGLRVLQLDAVSKVCSAPISSPKHLRILQWNVLSQSLGQNNDGFVCCPDEALTWDCRKYQIIQEIIQHDPDVICLQEVDHFKFLQNLLGTRNYEGVFFPKPDSPCLYIEANNGPDGCAIFYKKTKFELINCSTRILEVWRVQSNQVAIVANLSVIETGQEFCIGTTHLKARHGALLSKLRNEQGKDLLRFVKEIADNRPVILSGDFNAEPIEPVYSTILNFKPLGLASAYSDILSKEMKMNFNHLMVNHDDCARNDDGDNNVTNKENIENFKTKAELSAAQEPKYTTWKIREDGEVCHTIDYVFFTKDKMKVHNCLMFPHENEIGKTRAPSFLYPSDHFSLVCDFEFADDEQ